VSLRRDHHREQLKLGERAFEAKCELTLRQLAKRFASRWLRL